MSADRYCEVRAWTERLAAPLSAEDQTVQSMPDISPTKWHRAHTSWFFETFILGPGREYAPFDPLFAVLFNSYYEQVGERYPRAQRGVVSRPGVAEVARYRRHVDEAMVELLGRPLVPQVAALVELGLHHEQQHQELLLMDIKHVLSLNPARPAYVAATAAAPAGPVPAGGWREHSGGILEIGAEGAGFAFDNEYPRHQRVLRRFEIAADLVTCGQWREFMADGGYRRPDLWMSDGWALATAEGWSAPLYWDATDAGEPAIFTLHGPRPVDASEPVTHVSWYEADAFARWAGARLPDEAEWEVAAPDAPAATPDRGPAELGHPRPSPDGGWYGQVWQWTASPYGPYPGFRPAAGAVGEYNGKFMVNQFALRGSSCATPPGHARRTYRNFFPPSARWPFTGLRLVRDGG